MSSKPIKFSLKRFKIYEVVTLGLIGLSTVLAIMHWSGIIIVCLLILQFEVVNYNVAFVISQYKLLAQKRIKEPSYSKLQLFLKNLFLL